ncbi:MAG: CsgG/HfaB family protein [Candidatus Marinimicrobia bacterium]|nr:CsgG/HfaB family protein [Candidatus Neomarinimicrobiota bacterium]
MQQTIRSIFILFILAGPIFCLQDKKLETVAVLNFLGRGVSNIEAELLTDRFSTTLAQTKALQLVERNEMDNILKEQDFQSSGCTDASCAVEIGKMLNVEYMISGSIGKLGSTYTIDIKMFSVESGENANAIGQTYRGDIDGLIEEIEKSAWLIVDLPPPGSQEAIAAAAAAELAKRPPPVVKPPNLKMGAALRSTVIPGLGQLKHGKRLMGFTLLAAEVGLGLTLMAAKSDYDAAVVDQDHFNLLYDQTSDLDELVLYRSQVDEAYQRGQDAADMMTYMAGGIGVIHVVNIIHAYVVGGAAEAASTPANTAAGFKLDFSNNYSGVTYEIPIF